MRKLPNISQKLRQSALVACAASAFAFSLGCKKQTSEVQKTEPAGRSVVMLSYTDGVSEAALAGMRWVDIAPTVETCAKDNLSDRVLVVAAPLTQPPVIYLRGLLAFSRNDAKTATAEWGKLDPAAIPADFLYAPWRLAAASGGDNRYAAPLATAVKEGRTSALVEARFNGATGAFREALAAYLRTDAAAWTPYEVALFRQMKQHAPSSHDTDLLIAGALQGKRVPKILLKDLAEIIKEPFTFNKEAFAAALKADPALAKAATAAAGKMLALRQAFASNRFVEVVEMNRNTDPLQAADETVLLTFLAAAKVNDQEMTDRWGQELRRRKPSEDINRWIQQIKTEKR